MLSLGTSLQLKTPSRNCGKGRFWLCSFINESGTKRDASTEVNNFSRFGDSDLQWIDKMYRDSSHSPCSENKSVHALCSPCLSIWNIGNIMKNLLSYVYVVLFTLIPVFINMLYFLTYPPCLRENQYLDRIIFLVFNQMFFLCTLCPFAKRRDFTPLHLFHRNS